jgi:hypothetical protein
MVRLRSVSWMGWMGVAMVRLERSFLPLCVSIPLHWEIQGTQIVPYNVLKRSVLLWGSHVGHEKQNLALLTAIGEEHCREELASLSNLGIKGSMELRNLECSINYDARGEFSSRGKGKAHTSSVYGGCHHVGL